MRLQSPLRMGQNPTVNALRDTNSGESRERPVVIERERACLCCSATFQAKAKGQRFCSSRCRLLYWAASEIVKEYQAGNANGLRSILEDLKL